MLDSRSGDRETSGRRLPWVTRGSDVLQLSQAEVVSPLHSAASVGGLTDGKHQFVAIPANLASRFFGGRNSSMRDINPLLFATHVCKLDDHSDTSRSRSVTCVTLPTNFGGSNLGRKPSRSYQGWPQLATLGRDFYYSAGVSQPSRG